MTNLILLNDEIARFQQEIWRFYRNGGKRDFAWRGIDDAYAVLVSEMMLQQTQTGRVVPKFDEWMAAFPTAKAVAEASLSDVLSHWVGLGYNRRAVFLQKACREVCEKWGGAFPRTKEDLQSLSGIGPYTAGAVSTFAFNQPNVFIETNIRSVFIWYFFSNGMESALSALGEVSPAEVALSAPGKSSVTEGAPSAPSGLSVTEGVTPERKIDDKELLPLIEQTLVKDNPREWYYALMDYGADLKKRLPNPSRSSRHHVRQSRFEGSLRQARGAILRQLSLKGGRVSLLEISKIEGIDLPRLEKAGEKLIAEHLVSQDDGLYTIRN